MNKRLQLFVYGKVIAGNLDPIEKKPVTHYRPGTSIFSIATTGCNWLCKYCQNYDISQRRKIEGTEMTPKEVVDMAIRYGAHGIAYTYNEPSIFIEFAKDCGIEAHKRDIFNIFVSNGYDTADSVAMMSKFLDCITVDFKGSGKQEFVRQYIGIPNADPIFESLKEIRDKTKIHVEITDLIVPKVGDDLQVARKLCKFVYDELGPDTPIHFLRFHPDYKMMEFDNTPIETLERHHAVAKEEGLKYAYIGNVPGHRLEHTYCPECNSVAIERYGFSINSWNLDQNNCCKKCGYPISIIGRLTNRRKTRFQFI
jgi:pyruvate formate lyase activating enzyme